MRVVNGSGAASANVSNVSVACAQAYAIGGTVAGLTGTGWSCRIMAAIIWT